jgi:hypothetical protein
MSWHPVISARLLRSHGQSVSPAKDLPKFNYAFGFVYVFAGSPERAFEDPEWRIEIDGLQKPSLGMWDPAFAPLRKTERFKALMRKAKLVDYWRSRGWPDLCHPTSRDDFACD